MAYEWDSRKYLVAIDNANIGQPQHARYGVLPFVKIVHSDALDTNDFDKPFPFDEEPEIIYGLSRERLYARFGEKLPTSFYDNFRYLGALKFIVYQNSIWRQYNAFDETFEKSYTEKCSEETLESLKSLDLKKLEFIFEGAKDRRFLIQILERRDQVVNFLEQKK